MRQVSTPVSQLSLHYRSTERNRTETPGPSSAAKEKLIRAMQRMHAQGYGHPFLPFQGILHGLPTAFYPPESFDGDYAHSNRYRLAALPADRDPPHRRVRRDTWSLRLLAHLIGRLLGSFNHPDIAASHPQTFRSRKICGWLEKHGIFQGLLFLYPPGMTHLRDQSRPSSVPLLRISARSMTLPLRVDLPPNRSRSSNDACRRDFARRSNQSIKPASEA